MLDSVEDKVVAIEKTHGFQVNKQKEKNDNLE